MKTTIQTLNNISNKGLSLFNLENYNIAEEASDPVAIMLRSKNIHNLSFGKNLVAVARAGAGTNNIPISRLSQLGIPVFNTPGANANAVKELVIASLFLAARNLCQAWHYTQQLTDQGEALNVAVESGKKQFSGFELPGRKIGIIGLGSIGVKVANACMDLGMDVAGYDPDISVRNAWALNAGVKQKDSIDDVMLKADIISLHVPLTDETRNLINEYRLSLMKSNAILINLARGGIVDEQALIAFLTSKNLTYITDFPNQSLKNLPQVISLPHLGASTQEAEENCAVMAAQQLIDFLEKGHIKHSINFPDIHMRQPENAHRLVISNKNIPGMVSIITATLADQNGNIIDMINKSRGELAISLIDLDQPVDQSVLDILNTHENILNARCC